MSLHALSQLHVVEANAPMSPPHPGFVALCRELAAVPLLGGGRPVRVYALLERWRDNPLAAALDAEYPKQASARSPVRDDFFRNREDDAPCIVPLPEALRPATADDSLAGVLAREWFGSWLEAAWREAQRRLAPQHFGAVLFSCDSAREVARHLSHLGFQTPPQAQRARMFRYQDPRVMQRVWPALTPRQRKLWMGPVLQWWSLTQPWGAWDANEQEPEARSDVIAPAWFKAAPSEPPTGKPDTHHSLRRLFDPRQWALAHAAPIGNRVWRRYADAAIATADQPGGGAMNALLAEGLDLGLEGANLEDFAWCSSQPGYCAADQQSIPWHSPGWAPVLARVLSTLKHEPDASFAGVFHDIVQPLEKATA